LFLNVACSIVASPILASSMREIHNDKHCPMTSGGKQTRAINIGRFKLYKVRTEFDKWGREINENPNGSQWFPNWHATIIAGYMWGRINNPPRQPLLFRAFRGTLIHRALGFKRQTIVA
jgi:hypothetical protein